MQEWLTKNPPDHDKHVVQSLQTFRLYIKTFSNSIFKYIICRPVCLKFHYKYIDDTVNPLRRLIKKDIILGTKRKLINSYPTLDCTRRHA